MRTGTICHRVDLGAVLLYGHLKYKMMLLKRTMKTTSTEGDKHAGLWCSCGKYIMQQFTVAQWRGRCMRLVIASRSEVTDLVVGYLVMVEDAADNNQQTRCSLLNDGALLSGGNG